MEKIFYFHNEHKIWGELVLTEWLYAMNLRSTIITKRENMEDISLLFKEMIEKKIGCWLSCW